MARILYSLCGEGLGHATRSFAFIKELAKEHEIKVLCGGKSYPFLCSTIKEINSLSISSKSTNRKSVGIEHIESLRIQFKGTSVQNIKTAVFNVMRLRSIISSIRHVSKIVHEFKPNVIISDFEPWVAYVGRRKKIPLISIDNEHIITHARLDSSLKYKIKHMLSYIFVKLMIPKANHYFITSFYYPPLRENFKKNTDYVSFIVRDCIRKLIPSIRKNLVLVYTSSDITPRLVETMKTINKQFVVYNSKVNRTEGNIEFKSGTGAHFFKDLARCEAIITTAGLSLISEAIYLKKPIYAMPVSHFEQILNAQYVEKLGYGMHAKKITKQEADEFFSKLNIYRKNLAKVDNFKINNDVSEAIRKINAKIKELCS